MIVKLPKKFIGSKIIDAFKSVNSYQMDENHKLETEEFTNKFVYDLKNNIQQSPFSKGININLFYSGKKYIFWGKKIWKKDYTLTFKLKPITLDQKYDQIDIEFKYIYSADEYNLYVTKNPNHPSFKTVEPILKSILKLFTHKLK